MITAILVDDEEKALKTLSLLIQEHCPDVKVVATASNALEAVKNILHEKPDAVFLDVQMPGYNGFDILDQIKDTNVTCIFTTAHKDYAINALRKGAFDYLLKPLDIEELVACVERVKHKLNKNAPASNTPGIIELSVKDGIIFVKQEQVIRLEASGSYTTFHLENNVRHMVSKTMKEYEALLDSNMFFRCHNSHIINLKKVIKFSNNGGYFAELSNGASIEIARRNKDTFLDRLKKLGA
jgi:two-component system LytT family response regulator